MAKSTNFNIKEADLAHVLGISRPELDEIIHFFDADATDEWELRENEHFIFINKTYKERLFSEQGAYAIATYLDTKARKSIWQQFIEFITRHRERIRNAFISRKIQENCSSLALWNQRHFLSKKDVINILCTSPGRLNQAFKSLQQSSDMIFNEDFADIEGVRYYSISGLYKLSRLLATELKSKNRRDWCGAIEIVGKRTFKLIIDEETARQKRIKAAMDAARRRDKHRCQITGQKPDKYQKFNLVIHHIYCQKSYPHLAACQENLITLTQAVHEEFHTWNGGSQQPCTADDLIRFVNQLYPDNYEVILRLNQAKQILATTKER